MYELVMFDFFKTLTPDVYFSSFHQPLRQEITRLLFKPPNNELWETPWMCGRKTSAEVFDYLSISTGCSREELYALTRRGMEGFRWNKHVWSFSQDVRRAAKTAIVTINCDLFHQHIVPFFQLDTCFDAIISSDRYGITSKADLCTIAVRELLGHDDVGRALLIDDKPENTEGFCKIGGRAILYKDDEMFGRQLREDPYLYQYSDIPNITGENKPGVPAV